MNFEFNIEGIVEAARACSAKRIALQFPEGLMEYSCRLSEEVRDNCHKAGLASVEEVVILGEAIFGACCIDDTLSKLLRVELIVHFGHSRVVSRAITDSDGVTAMYIPVIAKESSWSPEDGCAKIMEHFGPADRLALESTAQFLKGAVKIAEQLKANGRSVICPKIGDLAPGETLGCTSPTLKDIDAIVYIGDGRFHVEAAAIANPTIPTFRYDPYTKAFSREDHDAITLLKLRKEAMKQAREAKLVGIAVSTLGRQASKTTLRQIEGLLAECGVDYITVLMDDVSPVTLAKFTDVEAWIQMACPRLSLDWASGFSTPILTTHEAIQTFDPSNSKQEWTSVPMDNWASGPNHYRQN